MVFALTTGWKNSKQTAPLLSELAVKDTSSSVRRAALTALATNYRDADGTLELLRDRALNDQDPAAEAKNYGLVYYVRSTAIEAIARHWPDHPDTLMLLLERVENDPTEWLRKRAKELADRIETAR
jgi:HEAT repeat protein